MEALTLKWLEGLVPPAVFLAALWLLWEPKLAPKAARWALGGFLAAQVAVQGTLCALGHSPELVFTLLAGMARAD